MFLFGGAQSWIGENINHMPVATHLEGLLSHVLTTNDIT